MTKNIVAVIKKEFKHLNWLVLGVFILIFIVLVGAYILIFGTLLETPTNDWLSGLLISSSILFVAGIITYYLVDKFGTRVQKATTRIVNQELGQLRAAHNRSKALQAMAATLRATLSFEPVVEEALNVCSLALEETGIPRQSLVGAVFLFDGEELAPVATRRFIGHDHKRSVPGKRGIVGAALRQAEPTVTDTPRQDPELKNFVTFQNCLTAVCIPLRAGFQIFGAMVIGSNTAVQFQKEQFKLFDSVADQAVIALQNAQLYQELEGEKQRLIEADEEARKELARDLHDGPTQTIAAIAMRVNFIRSLINRDPEQVAAELQKVEELAKKTSREIRGMLFTLRPLVLETQGLSAAIETVMKRIRETDGLNMRLIGGDNGDLLNESAQSVVFSIVEEALGNARKHSEANLIEVRFWREDNLFVTRIQDDGVGFDPQDVNRDYSSRGSLGMINMRERAARIDGSLRVESVPKQGTTITLVVPLEKHGRHVSV